VQVRALVGRRAVAQTTVRLTRQKRTGRCVYAAVLRPTKAKTRSARSVAVSARFLGTSRLKARSSVTKRVRIADARRAVRAVSLKVGRTPKRGQAKRLTATGQVVLPTSRPRVACGGRVQVRALVGRRAVAQTTVRLTRQKRTGRCVYAAVLRPTTASTRSARAVAFSARFLGTSLLEARSSVTRRVAIR
jgi:hypothetical protein